MNQSRKISPRFRRPGFTMVELMISIALSLLLIVGINAIFKTTADTVGVSQATLSDTRDLRNAFDAFDYDFNGFMDSGSQPVLLIYNQSLPGFRDNVDMKLDTAYQAAPGYENALHVFDSSGAYVPTPRVGGGATGASVYSDNRNHRIDILSFFSSAKFRRMTGQQNDTSGTYQSLYNSGSAYIWYGHARLPDGNNANWATPGKFLPPGITAIAGNPQTSTNNPNGFFANQWVLARMAIPLGTPQNGAILGQNANGGTVAQAYLNPTIPPSPGPQDMLRPFGYNTPATYNGVAPIGTLIQDSTCDLAGISASDFAKRTQKWAVTTLASGTPVRNGSWYYPLLSQQPFGSTATPDQTFRFACKPWITRGNTNSQVMRTDFALSSPAFVRGCSQFIVEFAGDYFEQSIANSDRANGQRSDGILDFDIVQVAGPAAYQKRVRWYGWTRTYPDNPNPNFPDVQSVYAFATQSPLLGARAVALPFEKISFYSPDSFPFLANPPGTAGTVGSYTCAWSPHDFQWPTGTPGTSGNLSTADDSILLNLTVVGGTLGPTVKLPAAYPKGFMPWMIRITMRVDDPNGRLQDGQTIQYVFNLPHP